MDLRDELDQLAGRPSAPSTAQLDADLARGRSALTRRRALQAGGGSVFVIAAAVAAISLASTGTAPADRGVTAIGDRAPATATKAGIKLVAYKGEQPQGFTIDTVPDGWFVQDSADYGLVIAPISAQNPGPDVNPSKSPIYDPQDYRGKIAIFLQSKDQTGPGDGEKVDVGGKEGVLVKSPPAQIPGEKPRDASEDNGWTLWVEQPNGVSVLVQFWEDLGMSKDQMVEIGKGVHVHKDAKQGVG